jgi:hypothetical protein
MMMDNWFYEVITTKLDEILAVMEEEHNMEEIHNNQQLAELYFVLNSAADRFQRLQKELHYTDELKEGAYKNFLKYENSHFKFDDSTRKAAEKLGIPTKILSAVIYCYTTHDAHHLHLIKHHCLKTMPPKKWEELTMEAREQASRMIWDGEMDA